MSGKLRINTVADLLNALQSVTNEGYNIHAIELATECGNCSSDITMVSPTLEILRSEGNHSIKLLFRTDD